ncbi:(2Fe-2S)-binding protein [Azospirillum sp. ST 5-10]|uniref:(2Fe-2S)-binding protein n=1 Tax=unclassified Azospirillum TaxID=2630922 RepID=UPI003F4A3E23
MSLCQCYDLTEKTIRKAVAEKGLSDADAVYDHFKVEPCGACADEITAVVADETAKSGT